MGRARFIGAEIFRQPAFGKNHPLSISRLGAVEKVCREFGWLDDETYEPVGPATIDELSKFHDRNYVLALAEADREGAVSVVQRAQYQFGTMENPVFPGLFERAATTVGGSIRAAEIALSGDIAVHFGGGTHHGRPDRASGFCYFNDPVFAILTLLEGGLSRVAYVDLDAHHGDGVEEAFLHDERVLTASIHEQDRWPYSGVSDGPEGTNTYNAAVPAGLNDSELSFLTDEWLRPLLASFRPDAVVMACGADALEGDPLSRLAISNRALQSTVLALIEEVPKAVVLGGGGYNPWTTVRAWSGLWGRIAGYEPSDSLPPEIVAMFKGFECDLVDEDDIDASWLGRLDDAPHDGLVRDAIKVFSRKTSAPAGV